MDKRLVHASLGTSIIVVLAAISVTIIDIGNSSSAFENASDFIVTGQAFQNSEVIITNCRNFTVYNNTFVNATLRIDITPGNISRDFRIYNNSFVNGSLLILFGSPSERGITDFNVFNNNLRNSIKIAAAFAANGTIANNHIVDCQHGIATRGVTNVTIEGNMIENSREYGIYLGTQPADRGTQDLTVKCNVVVNASNGIGRYYGSEATKNVRIEENQFVDCNMSDILADFSGFFFNNTVTAKNRIRLINAGAFFEKNRDLYGGFVQPGDINGDGKIDMRDIAVVCRHYGEENNSELDVIQDGRINIMDIAFLCKHYGIEP